MINYLTKEQVKQAVGVNHENVRQLLLQYTNVGDTIAILENLGQLPPHYDEKVFLPYLKHENNIVRYWAVKNLGKLRRRDLIDTFYTVGKTDSSTDVRKEAVACIGRMRLYEGVKYLADFLLDEDPKVACQAIRGMLVFKGMIEVDEALKDLRQHPNEIIQSVIEKEYFAEKVKQNIISHTESYPFMRNVVVNGDVREVLKFVPDESIHLTFTSPPYYNARDYSIYPSYDAYLNFLAEVFQETHRITKEGRFLIVNTSPVIVPRISRKHQSKRYPIPFDLHTILMQMGWEFIDDIVWMKPEYSVKNRIGGFQQHRKPLGYKPNSVTEYLMVYRKKTEKLLDWNMHKYSREVVEASLVPDGYESTNVWQICPQSDKVHSAIFPVDLCKRVIQYYSYKGDIVFDPFAGSGTVGRTAKSLDRLFFLTEKEEKYFEYMQTFIAKNALFEENRTRFITLEEFQKLSEI